MDSKKLKRIIEKLKNQLNFIKRNEHYLRKLFVILQTIASIILIAFSNDYLLDSWYYFSCHLLLSLFGLYILFIRKKENSNLIFSYVILLSGLLITASFSFFWYSGQFNVIKNTCISDDCNETRKYYFSKMMRVLSLIIVEAIALHPNLSWLIQVSKKERKNKQLNCLELQSKNDLNINSKQIE